MGKRSLIAIAVVVTLAAVMLGAASAQARPKTWHKVMAMSGGAETYTDQYKSRPFRLTGGQLKLVADVVPDPELIEQGMEDMWLAGFYVDPVSANLYKSFYATMDPAEGSPTSMQWRFRLPKGRYVTSPITANCTWSYTLYEKKL